MDTINQLLGTAFDQPLGFVLSIIINSSVILGGSLLFVRLKKKLSPTLSHFVLSLAIASVLVLPLFMVALSTWQVPIISNGGYLESIGIQSSFLQGGTPQTPRGSEGFFMIIFILWVAVGSIRALQLLLAFARKRSIIKHSVPLKDARIERIFSSSKRKIELNGAIRLLKSKEDIFPFTSGWLRAAVVLPERHCKINDESLSAIFLHELAHVKRRDALSTTIALVASVVYWFHPLVWVALRQSIFERERACDDYVVNTGVKATDYAELLLALTRQHFQKTSLFPVGTALLRKSSFEKRIKSILSSEDRSARLKLSSIALHSLVVLSATVVLSCLGQTNSIQTPNAGDVSLLEEESQSIVPPERVFLASPEYPDEVKKLGYRGVVWVDNLVDTTGNVERARVSKSSGFEILDNAALKAAWKNKYKPAMVEGMLIKMWVTYPVEFVPSEAGKEKIKEGK